MATSYHHTSFSLGLISCIKGLGAAQATIITALSLHRLDTTSSFQLKAGSAVTRASDATRRYRCARARGCVPHADDTNKEIPLARLANTSERSSVFEMPQWAFSQHSLIRIGRSYWDTGEFVTCNSDGPRP